MKEERKDITLPLGHVSLSEELGPYYIDMRPAIVHYTEGLYGGAFDEKGVPMIGGPDGPYYYPINVAQYGFMLHADWMERPSDANMKVLLACLEVLERIKSEDERHCVWWHHVPMERYGIEPPWASAMAQGEVMSFYLRMSQALGDAGLVATATKAFRFLEVDHESGGVRRRDRDGYLWLEEYPSDPPSYVLNGFIYALFGLYDLFRVTRDPDVQAEIDECLRTLVAKLPSFDSGYWSNYDLLKRELVRYYYQKNVHVPQLAVLYELTGNPVFREYRDRWKRQLTPLNYLLVQLMYRVRPRVQRLRAWWLRA